MKERSLYAYISLSLLVGVVVGFVFGFGVYTPKIDSLQSQVNDLNTRLDRALPMVEEMEGVVELSTSEVDDLVGRVDDLGLKLEALSDDSRLRAEGLDVRLDSLENRVDNLGEEVQNENTIIDVYDKVSPAVVFITSTTLTFDFRLQMEVPAQGVGSGVVVSSEGYILTNNHVVEGADNITVSFKPGEEVTAELVGADPPTDLAVIKIDPIPGIPVASLGDSDRVKVGMTAIAIGNPFSLERTVTTGVVSSVNRTIDAVTGDIIFGIIQTDASINPGNSGGPLVNSEGDVIGINSAIISPVRGSVGIGFSIPINTAKRVMTQLIETGRVSRPYLGVTGGSVSGFPPEMGLPGKGVLLVDVIIDSPADKAGLQGSPFEVQIGSFTYPEGGDVILRMDQTSVDTVEDMLEILSKKRVGDQVTITYLRDGVERTVEVVLEERPG